MSKHGCIYLKEVALFHNPKIPTRFRSEIKPHTSKLKDQLRSNHHISPLNDQTFKENVEKKIQNYCNKDLFN